MARIYNTLCHCIEQSVSWFAGVAGVSGTVSDGVTAYTLDVGRGNVTVFSVSRKSKRFHTKTKTRMIS